MILLEFQRKNYNATDPAPEFQRKTRASRCKEFLFYHCNEFYFPQAARCKESLFYANRAKINLATALPGWLAQKEYLATASQAGCAKKISCNGQSGPDSILPSLP